MEAETELKEFYQILCGILHNDNAIRKQCEERLKGYLAIPSKLLINLVRVMQVAGEDYIRKLASVLFKHYVALVQANTLWRQIGSAEQELIRTELLNALKKELNPKVAKQICVAVGELASLIFEEGKDWPQLDELIAAYVGSNDFMVETAFRILGTLFALSTDRYLKNTPALFQVFDNAFAKTNPSVMVMVIQAMCILVTELDTEDVKPFLKYSTSVLHGVQIVMNSDNEDLIHELMDAISDVAENEPIFFRHTFPAFAEAMIKMSSKKDYDNEKLRQIPLEILVCVIERLPGMAKKRKPQVWNLCAALFQLMISIEEEVDSDWLSPKEGYDIEEDLNPDDNVNFGLICYDRMISSLEDDYILPIYEKILESSLANEDWRFKNAGLLVIGQIGEYLEGIEKVKNLVPILITHLSHAHPKCRFASLSSIGLLADALQPEFQQEYYKEIIPPLIACTDDPVPRVQSHACAALSNFLEHVSESIATEVAPKLLPKLLGLIRGGISIIKENAVTCISSIAESAAEGFIPYYKEIVPFLFECVGRLVTKEYHLLRGQTIECLTIISAAIGKEYFVEYSSTLIDLMIRMQEGELSKGDPRRFYLLGAWQRVCLLLQSDFAVFLPRIVPRLLKIVSTVPGMGLSSGLAAGSLDSIIKEVSGEKRAEIDLSTSEIEEIEMGLQMLQVFATEMSDKFAPYVEETTGIVEPMLTFGANSELRKQSAKLLSPLLECLKKAGSPSEVVVKVGSKYIADLLHAHSREIHTDVRSAQILGLKYVFDTIGHFMSASDTTTMITKVMGLFKDGEDRKNAIIRNREAVKDEEEEEEELGSEYEDSIEFEEDYLKDLSYLLGSIINHHKDESLPHVHSIVTNLIQPYLTANTNMQKVALFILDDIAEYLGVEKLGESLWKQIVPIILNYCNKPEHDLRQAACYGIGCLAKSGGTAFKEIATQCLTILAVAIELKKDKKNSDEWAETRDNAIASIGKILKYQASVVPFGEIWAKWLLLLPLREDKGEAKEAHQFVVDTLIAYPDVAVGSGGSLLAEIIRIFVGVFETKLVSKETRHNIVKAMKQLSAHSAVVGIVEEIYKTKLSAEDKVVLEKILKS